MVLGLAFMKPMWWHFLYYFIETIFHREILIRSFPYHSILWYCYPCQGYLFLLYSPDITVLKTTGFRFREMKPEHTICCIWHIPFKTFSFCYLYVTKLPQISWLNITIRNIYRLGAEPQLNIWSNDRRWSPARAGKRSPFIEAQARGLGIPLPCRDPLLVWVCETV